MGSGADLYATREDGSRRHVGVIADGAVVVYRNGRVDDRATANARSGLNDRSTHHLSARLELDGFGYEGLPMDEGRKNKSFRFIAKLGAPPGVHIAHGANPIG